MTTLISRTFPFLFLPLLLFACSKKTEEAENALNQMQQAAENLEKTAETMNQSLTGDHKPVNPVHFKALMSFLPTSITGLENGTPEGETQSFGEWSFSVARVGFHSADGLKSANVEILDYAYISALYAPYTLLLNMKFSRESSSGYERSTTIAGFPAFEKWEQNSNDAEINILVGQRFIVTVRTTDMGEGSARQIAESLALKKLATQTTS